MRGRSAGNHLKHIINEDVNAGIIKEPAVQFGEVLTIPGDDVRQQFRHVNGGIGAHHFKHAPQGESKSQAANQHVSLGTPQQPLAGELGEYFFRLRSIGAHERLIVHAQEKLSASLME